MSWLELMHCNSSMFTELFAVWSMACTSYPCGVCPNPEYTDSHFKIAPPSEAVWLSKILGLCMGGSLSKLPTKLLTAERPPQQVLILRLILMRELHCDGTVYHKGHSFPVLKCSLNHS